MKRAGKIKLKISIPFVLMIASLYVLDFRNVMFPTLVAVIIHEFAHIIAIRVCGGTIDKVEIRAFGIRVNVPELKYMSYKREIVIAAAGPFAGIITAVGAAAAAELFCLDSLGYFVGVNIAVTAINMIPVYPLDGGRILLSASLKLFSVRAAYAICYVTAIVSISAMFALCAYFAARGLINPSLVIFSLYIAICGIKFRPQL